MLAFADDAHVDTGEAAGQAHYEEVASRIPALEAAIAALDPGDARETSPAVRPAAIEFVLEGLHLNKLLNKSSAGGYARYGG